MIKGSQLGAVLAVVCEAVVDGRDVGVAFKEHPDIAVVVETNDPNYFWVHRIRPSGGRTASLTSKSVLEAGAK